MGESERRRGWVFAASASLVMWSLIAVGLRGAHWLLVRR
jgi:nitrate reductase NapE component